MRVSEIAADATVILSLWLSDIALLRRAVKIPRLDGVEPGNFVMHIISQFLPRDPPGEEGL